MKLAISNIAWSDVFNERMYQSMADMGFSGIEIAPTKLFPDKPYKQLEIAAEWSTKMQDCYGLRVASMQSIWYGKTENIFNSSEDRELLAEYTKEAIRFAERIGCGNLVFGCPKNRNVGESAKLTEAVSFFREIGKYAQEHHTVIGMEANPPIYNTNYINDTIDAIELIKEVDSDGFRLNLDFGTIVYNQEKLDVLYDNVGLINHVHISEPGLVRITKRKEHHELANILSRGNYSGYVSIEMKQQENTSDIVATMKYLKEVFA